MSSPTKPPVDDVRSLQSLVDLALFIDHHVREVLQSHLVKFTADWFFHNHRSLFRTNVTNTLPYAAAAALEERASVHIAEIVLDKEKHFPTNAVLRGIEQLRNHRDALSHLRAGIVWDLQNSINEHLRAGGRLPHNEEVTLTVEMIFLLQAIVNSALNPGQPPHSFDELSFELHTIGSRYVELILEAHPTG